MRIWSGRNKRAVNAAALGNGAPGSFYATKPALVLTAACLIGLASSPSSRDAAAQMNAHGIGNAEPAPQPAEPDVSVFFGSARALTIEEIRAEAAAALRTSGHVMEDRFHCVVNVMVDGKEPGCAVIFQDLRSNMLYTVDFDRTGQARVLYARPVRHRTPKFGESVPGVPEGAVRVRP